MFIKLLYLPLVLSSMALAATELSTQTRRQIVRTSRTLAANLMSYYQPSLNGLLPQPYWPWEAAGLWSTMIHYHHYTGDAKYNNLVRAGILAQVGSSNDFMGPQTPGNDDQLWWGLTAMNAAEVNFPGANWLALAGTVFSEVVARWDNSTCSGGLHWQISESSNGYTYKNSITNGLAFQLAARLARHHSHGNTSEHYVRWAEKLFAWTLQVGYIDNATYSVYDGAHTDKACTDIDHGKWSYNVGVFLSGSALMFQHTKAPKWAKHVDGFVSALQSDFTTSDGVLQEKCEATQNCNADQKSFKAYVVRWLAEAKGLVSESARGKIEGVLRASVKGALGSCNGSPGRESCGVKWTEGGFDGDVGVGQQMGALEAVVGRLIGRKSENGVKGKKGTKSAVS